MAAAARAPLRGARGADDARRGRGLLGGGARRGRGLRRRERADARRVARPAAHRARAAEAAALGAGEDRVRAGGAAAGHLLRRGRRGEAAAHRAGGGAARRAVRLDRGGRDRDAHDGRRRAADDPQPAGAEAEQRRAANRPAAVHADGQGLAHGARGAAGGGRGEARAGGGVWLPRRRRRRDAVLRDTQQAGARGAGAVADGAGDARGVEEPDGRARGAAERLHGAPREAVGARGGVPQARRARRRGGALRGGAVDRGGAGRGARRGVRGHQLPRGALRLAGDVVLADRRPRASSSRTSSCGARRPRSRAPCRCGTTGRSSRSSRPR